MYSRYKKNKLRSPVEVKNFVSACFGMALSIMAIPAHSADFKIGPVQARTTALASVGTIIRAEKADPVLKANQAGNANFDRWDPVSTVAKFTADIDLSYKNYGVFLRGNTWYDYELKKGNRPVGNAANGFTPNRPLSDRGFPSEQKFSGAQLLDAYAYAEWNVSNMPVGLRVGRHALAWGESMLLGGGVNIINPYDVAALQRAGSELKEALLPVGMASVNIGVTNELNLSAFYQYEWEATRLPQCGTFFSEFDGIQEGCTTVDFGFGPMAGDFKKPSDDGQYGFAAQYYSHALNAELGAYYVNYHSRNPFLGNLNFVTNSYEVLFPEDIQILGVSLAGSVGSSSVYGEVAYRMDQPVAGGLTDKGYDTFDNWNFILGTLFSVPRFIGSDELSITAELGLNRTQSLPRGQYNNTTTSAWGYRVFSSLTYTDVFKGINVMPSLGLDHDINGVSADGIFIEDRVVGTLGVQFEYLKNYLLDINYTANVGKTKNGNGEYLNAMHDRDFIGAAVTVLF